MTPRFSFGPQPAPRDTEIMRRAKGLRVELWKDKDGDCHGDVKITCSFGMFGRDEILTEQDHEEHQREALRFIRDVLTSFERKPDEEGGCCG
jgi:hypothetical protein